MVFKGKFSMNAGVLGAMYCKKYCSKMKVTKGERHEAPRSTQSYGGNTDSSATHQCIQARPQHVCGTPITHIPHGSMSGDKGTWAKTEVCRKS